MRANKLIRRTLLLVMVLMMTLSMSFSILAASSIYINPNDEDAIKVALGNAAKVSDSGSNTVNKEDGKATSVVVLSKDDKSGKAELTLFSYDNGILSFDIDAFKGGRNKEVKKAMNAFVDGLKDSSIANDTQAEIMTQIQEADPDVAAMMIPMIFDNTSADLFTAYKWLYPFLMALRVVLGIGAVLIILLLLFSTVMDLCYIGLPAWRENTTEKSGGKKPFGVSYEALSTVMEVEKNLGEYRNAYLMYGKRRGLTYVVLSICILYLVVGELGGLISWLLSLVGGVVQ